MDFLYAQSTMTIDEIDDEVNHDDFEVDPDLDHEESKHVKTHQGQTKTCQGQTKSCQG